MHKNSETTDFDKGACVPHQKEVKTYDKLMNEDDSFLVRTASAGKERDIMWCSMTTEYVVNSITEKDDLKKTTSVCDGPVASAWMHYLSLFIVGLLSWGLLWCAWGDGWRWDGDWFRLAAVAAFAWGSGQALETLTGLPPLLAALLTGIFARNLNILDMRDFTQIDAFLRKIYPVVILGKASLGWNMQYMKSNWLQIAALGVLPWAAEVLTLAVCTNLLLGFPWIWGFLLGSFYASVSCAVVMPSVARVGAGAGASRNWAQLVCTAGGTDTALSVGVYGIIYSYMFIDADDVYRYAKAGLTVFAGVALGVTWGSVAGLVPLARDYYVSEMRVLFVLVGGLFGNFFTSNVGWGGTGGVAVLVCNATAATYWARKGWTLNKNPASTVYRVLWAACEPVLFAYTGTFFVLTTDTPITMLYGFAILVICLTVRLLVTAAVCWDMSMKERIFICCTWMPKSIVEAVLSPVAINTLLMSGHKRDSDEMAYAKQLLSLIVQAILITTPIGFLLTNHLGPWLLRKTPKETENGNGSESTPRKSIDGSQIEDAIL